MEHQEPYSYLLNSPQFVIEKILSHIHNLWNVSYTCKHLYEIVCGMYKRRRRVLHIRGTLGTLVPNADYTILTIDDDAVFDSIMNSLCRITEIRIIDSCYTSPTRVKLSERQLERMIAIMKRFGPTINSFKLKGFELSINSIVELLHQSPKLESLTFAEGRATAFVAEKPTKSLQLLTLKTLTISNFDGLLDIVNSIPAGTLSSYHFDCRIGRRDLSTDVLQNILTKQYNIRSLTVAEFADPAIFCVNNLELETLILGRCVRKFEDAELMDILRCHTNLKEFRMDFSHRHESSPAWICNNMKNLEVLEIVLNQYDVKMLGELKKLRHFRPGIQFLMDQFFIQFESDSLVKLEIPVVPFCSRELSDNIVHSLVRNFTNLTDLQMEFVDFTALSLVLSHCTKLKHLTSSITDPRPNQLTQQRFPNIQSLTLSGHISLQNMAVNVNDIFISAKIIGFN